MAYLAPGRKAEISALIRAAHPDWKFADQDFNWMEYLTNNITALLKDPAAAPGRAWELFTDALIALALASAIPFIGDEFDYGLGRIISQAMRPFTDRLISQPMDDALKVKFRYRGASPRLVIRSFQDGVIDEAALRDTLVEGDVNDRDIEKVLADARFKRTETLLLRRHAIEKAEDDYLYKVNVDQIDRILSEVRAIESDADSLISTTISAEATEKVSAANLELVDLKATLKSLQAAKA